MVFSISANSDKQQAAAEILNCLLNEPEGIDAMGSERGVPSSAVAAKNSQWPSQAQMRAAATSGDSPSGSFAPRASQSSAMSRAATRAALSAGIGVNGAIGSVAMPESSTA